jgi:DNA-binding NtrC family response regulator
MTEPAHILLYGRDRDLLESRCLVLESAGFKASTATELRAVEQRIGKEHLDLLIICYTISREARERVLAAIHAIQPDLRSLVLTETDFKVAKALISAAERALQGDGFNQNTQLPLPR